MARRTCNACGFAPVLKNAELCSWCAADAPVAGRADRIARAAGRWAAVAIAGYYAAGLLIIAW